MLQYSTIDYYGNYWGTHVIGFDKLDGNQMRLEFSRKRGFYKAGTKNMMIDETHPEFGFAIKIFNDKYQDSLSKVFNSKKYRNELAFVCFAELCGPNSEFGRHVPGENLDMILFDVSTHKNGLIHPKEFIDDFGHVGIPKIIYQGNLNMDLINDVKINKFRLREGLVCKGSVKKGGNVSSNLYYCKMKTNDWFERLKNNSSELYEQELKQANKSVIAQQ